MDPEDAKVEKTKKLKAEAEAKESGPSVAVGQSEPSEGAHSSSEVWTMTMPEKVIDSKPGSPLNWQNVQVKK